MEEELRELESQVRDLSHYCVVLKIFSNVQSQYNNSEPVLCGYKLLLI